MPKVSVYLPDDLYQRARARGLKLSALTQAAITAELEADPNHDWLEVVARRPQRTEVAIDTERLIDEVREGFGA